MIQKEKSEIMNRLENFLNNIEKEESYNPLKNFDLGAHMLEGQVSANMLEGQVS